MKRSNLVTITGMALLLSLAMMACAGSGDGTDGESGAGAFSSSTSKKTDAGEAGSKVGSKGSPEAGSEGGVAGEAALSVDGVECTVDSGGSLDTGLGGDGWTMELSATCATPIILKVSGVINAPYPQTALQASQEVATMLIVTRPDGSDADTFDTSDTSAQSTILRGPTSLAHSRVSGSAIVTDKSGASGTHTVAYDVMF